MAIKKPLDEDLVEESEHEGVKYRAVRMVVGAG